MGSPPAVIIVVRHGARLDAADKQWHLTSPTPYDPPLTYGGWTQSRALGARIAAILRSRETDDEIPAAQSEKGTHIGGDKRRRRHKVVIHTSPFLRCVQTSVAISAGLAQNPGHTTRPSTSRKNTALHSSPRMRPTLVTDSPKLEAIPEPNASAISTNSQNDGIRKSKLRVDAFLGEWLSPDYFELITPPPSSIMMVAGAKADLLRREDTSNLIHHKDISNLAPPQPFPGGWGSPIVPTDPNSPLMTGMSAMAQVLPRRDRTGSLSSVGSIRSLKREPIIPEYGVYAPPSPSYAISSSDPIPPGYVAHARDACVDVDYQWDSMREPKSWPNGGDYGEEWSSMHKRFRKGLQQMVRWYEGTAGPGDSSLFLDVKGQPKVIPNEVEDDDETELVVILVTHGAGCNALIGALTNQPVLLSVGMASLTMAVRKPRPLSTHTTPSTSPAHTPKQHSRVSSKVLGVSDEYELKLVANTDHLRPSAPTTPTISRHTSVSSTSTFRHRYGASAEKIDGVDINTEPARPGVSAGLGSMRRTASAAASTKAARPYVATRQGSIGLWNPNRSPSPKSPSDSGSDDMMLNFANSPYATPPVEKEDVAVATPKIDEMDEIKDVNENVKESVITENAVRDRESQGDEDVVPPLGLWGPSRPPGEAEHRVLGAKRRWTVTEARP